MKRIPANEILESSRTERAAGFRVLPRIFAYFHKNASARHEAAAIFLSGFACNDTLQLQRMLMPFPGGTGISSAAYFMLPLRGGELQAVKIDV